MEIACIYGHKRLAPQVGLEPTTLRLTAECSAIELLRSVWTRLIISIIIASRTPSENFQSDRLAVLPAMHALHFFEVFMRLFSAFSFIFLMAAAMLAGDDSKTSSTPSAPPKPAEKPVIDMYHGTRVLDNYRWLEDGTNPETQKWVEQEMDYTRGILDRLAGREAIHKRLTDLLSIGNVTPPVIAGRHY